MSSHNLEFRAANDAFKSAVHTNLSRLEMAGVSHSEAIEILLDVIRGGRGGRSILETEITTLVESHGVARQDALRVLVVGEELRHLRSQGLSEAQAVRVLTERVATAQLPHPILGLVTTLETFPKTTSTPPPPSATVIIQETSPPRGASEVSRGSGFSAHSRDLRRKRGAESPSHLGTMCGGLQDMMECEEAPVKRQRRDDVHHIVDHSLHHQQQMQQSLQYQHHGIGGYGQPPLMRSSCKHARSEDNMDFTSPTAKPPSGTGGVGVVRDSHKKPRLL